ncbi:type III-B CRISPR module-associated protein Cmr5 [Aminithiophilus ramosus]|uniref:CRISPR type III-B/RAMP module-associated protein Cmr5 n=2 Tax=Synergistales TaxID=649776 RepID=A0A9Q7ABU4_9BACT|nr:type III-B CRISPR module-associated protein Cmr5 [Aminithiophilus ramosus]QTX32133.1 type III-B CRISPR module-associated protein Cmr5 [Aminithiophilus ramosus]QVL36001.1 type III-B CRISPR module-associated protein Cmr5 [Synergistota bacterium]
MTERTLKTREQVFAQKAFAAVKRHRTEKKPDESEKEKENREKEEKKYCSLALSFPALIHGCGLAQALSFAMAKKRGDLADDLAATLGKPSGEALAEESRKAPLKDYLLLSREALEGAGWIKRYAATLLKAPEGGDEP